MTDSTEESTGATPGKLTECVACSTMCVGKYCSDECQEYWETRDQRL